jgi:hypothetical protein
MGRGIRLNDIKKLRCRSALVPFVACEGPCCPQNKGFLPLSQRTQLIDRLCAYRRGETQCCEQGGSSTASHPGHAVGSNQEDLADGSSLARRHAARSRRLDGQGDPSGHPHHLRGSSRYGTASQWKGQVCAACREPIPRVSATSRARSSTDRMPDPSRPARQSGCWRPATFVVNRSGRAAFPAYGSDQPPAARSPRVNYS